MTSDAPLSIFSSASDAAARIAGLASFMIVLSSVVFAVVVAIMFVAVRRNRHQSTEVDLAEHGRGWVIWGGAVIPGIVLVAVFGVALHAMGAFSPATPAVTVRVVGRQWWWQVEYLRPDGSTLFRTANEIHVPVGKTTRVLLTSNDVIHSFWIPQLQGKMDATPGHVGDLRLQARRAGTYSGACSEFCGQQHAHMAMSVVAETDSAFAVWISRQARNADVSPDSVASAGRTLFAGSMCAACHAVRGLSIGSDSAPDLTHVASRATIAGGRLPTTLGNLEGWIANPQALKPGTKMPTLRVYTGPQLRALATYVESLK
jgi:cytochrome c oxidase subunit 2